MTPLKATDFDLRNYTLNDRDLALLKGNNVEDIMDQYGNDPDWLNNDEFDVKYFLSYLFSKSFISMDMCLIPPRYLDLYVLVSYLKGDNKFIEDLRQYFESIKVKSSKAKIDYMKVLAKNSTNKLISTDEFFDICEEWNNPEEYDNDLVVEFMESIINSLNHDNLLTGDIKSKSALLVPIIIVFVLYVIACLYLMV